VEELSVEQCIPVSPAFFNQALNEAVPPKPRRRWIFFSRDREPPTVSRVLAFPHGSFFRRNRLLYVGCSQYELETMIMPGGGSVGLFAFDGDVLRCLNQQPERLQEILPTEAVPLDTAAPLDLANLFAEVCGRQGNIGHEVVTLSGWMHRTQTMEAWQVSLSEDYELTVRRDVLSDRIFKRVPDIMY